MMTTDPIYAVCFWPDGTRGDCTLTARMAAVDRVKRQPYVPFSLNPSIDLGDVTVETERVFDTGTGSSDRTTAVYAPERGDVIYFECRIGAATWRQAMVEGLKPKPVRSAVDVLLLLEGLYRPIHCTGLRAVTGHQDGVPFDEWYDILWVKPQPADPATDALVFRMIGRRRSVAVLERRYGRGRRR